MVAEPWDRGRSMVDADQLEHRSLFRGPALLGHEYTPPRSAVPFEDDPRIVESLGAANEELQSLRARSGAMDAWRDELSKPPSSSAFFARRLKPRPNMEKYLAVEAYDKRCLRVEGRVRQLQDTLRLRREDYEREERERLAPWNIWRASCAPAAPRRIEVFGGTGVGWEAFVLTYGTSLLGSDARLLVLDFTERGVATLLERLAKEVGYRTRRLSLPEHAGGLDLFAGLSGSEIVECVVSAWHDMQDNNKADLTTDAFLLDQIARCIEVDGPVTVARLYAALNALLGLELPGGEESSGRLTDEELLRLERLLGLQALEQVHVSARLLGMTAFLRALQTDVPSGGAVEPLLLQDVDLRLLELTPGGRIANKAALASVLIQVLQKRYVDQIALSALPTHILLLGADDLGRPAVDRLASLAEDADVQLTVVLKSLRSAPAQSIGVGDAVQLFMRLGNRSEAEHAAAQLGKRTHFVLSQYSTTESAAATRTYGEQITHTKGTSVGIMTINVGRVPLIIPSVSRNTVTAEGTSHSTATALTAALWQMHNRVRELIVEPEVLMDLGPYAMLYKAGPDDVRAIDCGPELVWVRDPLLRERYNEDL